VKDESMRITTDNVGRLVEAVDAAREGLNEVYEAAEGWQNEDPAEGGDREQRAEYRETLESALGDLPAAIADLLAVIGDKPGISKVDRLSGIGRIWTVVEPLGGSNVVAIDVIRQICINELGLPGAFGARASSEEGRTV